MPEYTISSRSRNLGYSWTCNPTTFYNDRGDSSLGFKPASSPDATGGLRAVEAEIKERRRVCSGGAFSRGDLFVAGERVVAFFGYTDDGDGEDGLPVNGRDVWLNVGSDTAIDEILMFLREGYEVKVRTEAAARMAA